MKRWFLASRTNVRIFACVLGLLCVTPTFAQLPSATAKPRRPEWWTAKVAGPLLTLQQFSTTTGQHILELRDSAGNSLWTTTLEGHTVQTGYVQPGGFVTASLPTVTANQAGAIAFDKTANLPKFVNNSGVWTAIGAGGAEMDTLATVTGRGATTTTDMITHAIGPGATNSYDLGSGATEWRNIYGQGLFANTAVLSPSFGYSGNSGTSQLEWGAGSPNGVKVALPGSIYLDTAGGAGVTLYVKESGVGTNTGWVAYNSAGGGGGYVDTDTLASVTARGATTTTDLTTHKLTPGATSTYDLGSNIATWNNGWINHLISTDIVAGTSMYSPLYNGGSHSGTVLTFCSGDPNGVLTADNGSICLDAAGGVRTSVWVKESGGISNTGWVGIGSATDTLDDVTLRGATSTHNLTLRNVTPSADITYNLGSPSARWSGVYTNGVTASQSVTAATSVITPKVQSLADSFVGVQFGAGSPNSSVTASPGSIYLNTTGGAGTTFYLKESGVQTNTGWTAVNPLGSSDTLQNVTSRGASTNVDMSTATINPTLDATQTLGIDSQRWLEVHSVNAISDTVLAHTSVASPKFQSTTDANFNIQWGVGTPNGVVTASQGSLYFNKSGGVGTTLWVKESGTASTTGWVAYSASGGGGGGLTSPGASVLVRTNASGALATTTIGTGLSFDGTTLSANNGDTLDTVAGRGNATFRPLTTGSLIPYSGGLQLGSSSSRWGGLYLNATAVGTDASFSSSVSVGNLQLSGSPKRVYFGDPTSSFVQSGSGSPNGSVNAPIGSLYLNTSGGAGSTLYVKESAGGLSTGWVAK